MKALCFGEVLWDVIEVSPAPPARAAAAANRLGAYVASHSGAIPEYDEEIRLTFGP